jgi:uridine phosphorylase
MQFSMGEALIFPEKGNDPSIGPVAVMAAMEGDVALVRRLMGFTGPRTTRILTSSVFMGGTGAREVSITGPTVGAPQTVMVLEKLLVLGAQKVIFLGWCGSFREHVKIGDLVIPDVGFVGEGTSKYYSEDDRPEPSQSVLDSLIKCCEARGEHFHKGPVWSTDAPYRETKDHVVSLQQAGVVGVDMEVSALFNVGRFRHVEIGALLVVSDELASLEWKPGFGTQAFKKARESAAEVVLDVCGVLAAEYF